MAFINAIAGYKTYIVATAAGIDAFGVYLGWWDESRVRQIIEGVFTVVFVRLGITKSGV